MRKEQKTILCMYRMNASKYPAKRLPSDWVLIPCSHCGEECMAPAFYKQYAKDNPTAEVLCAECCTEAKEQMEEECNNIQVMACVAGALVAAVIVAVIVSCF